MIPRTEQKESQEEVGGEEEKVHYTIFLKKFQSFKLGFQLIANPVGLSLLLLFKCFFTKVSFFLFFALFPDFFIYKEQINQLGLIIVLFVIVVFF